MKRKFMRSGGAIGVGVLLALVTTGLAVAASSIRVPTIAYVLRAQLDSAQVAPALAAPVAGAKGTFDGVLIRTHIGEGRRGAGGTFVWRLSWRVTYSGLTGTPASVELRTGVVGAAGAQLAALCAGCASPARGTINNLTPVQAAALLNGSSYVLITTAKNPSGEIRGQIHKVRMQRTSPPAPPSTSPSSGNKDK